MMRAFEQAWALLKADPLAQGRMGSLPPAIPSMIERERRAGTKGLPDFIEHSGEARQGYPDVAQSITPITDETTMARMGSGRNLEANLPIPITETMPEEAFMTEPERRMARRGLGAARRRTESGARGDTGFTPYRTKEGMLADNTGVASPTRLRRDSKPTEGRPMRTGKPTVDQGLADLLEQMAADNPNASFDRPPEVDEKPEPKSGGFNEKLEAAGRGGRRFNRTQQSIAGQDGKPNLQAVSDAMDPEAMSQARLMELAAQLGKRNGASQTAVDQTA